MIDLEQMNAVTDARGVTYSYHGVSYTMPIDVFDDYISLGYTNFEVRAIVWQEHFDPIFGGLI